MKLTDMIIIFSIIMLPMQYTMELYNKYCSRSLIYSEQMNAVLDEAVEDALACSIDVNSTNNHPQVNLEKLSGRIISLICLGVSGNDIAAVSNIIKGRIPFIIYTDKDGFYCYSDETWSERIMYTGRNHSDRITQIDTYINEIIGMKYTVMIPKNDGDDYRNSLYPYSVIAFYRQPGNYYCFGGARITIE